MRFDRRWAMPNKNTFLIAPIRDLLKEELTEGRWIDPFAGSNSPASVTNDLNPNINTTFHMDALEFLQFYGNESVDGVLFDPPYSVRQVAECYKAYGYPVTQETTRSDFYTKIKHEIARIVKPNGKVISFGWNSMGIGEKLGFEKTRILLVPHGGVHNDTIVVVEIKSSVR